MADNANGDTPDQTKPGETPPAGTDTPPKQGDSSTSDEGKNELERERARAATALKEKEAAEKRARDEKIARIRAEKALKAAQGSGGDGSGGDGSSSSGAGGNDAEEEIVRANAEKGVYALVATNPEYQTLLSKDPTLKEVLINNPLSLIRDFIDPEDAVDQIKKYMDNRLQMAGSSASASTDNPGGGDQPPKKDVPPPQGKTEMTGTVTPQQAQKMSPAEWAKLPKEQRQKMLEGNF